MSSVLKTLAQRIDRLGKAVGKPPPGFDAGRYLELNPDIAAAHIDPDKVAAHYVAYGMAEMRKLIPDGVGVEDREHRMLATGAERHNWRSWLSKQGDLRKCLAQHPRSDWLKTDFNLASYLLARPDVAAELDDPLEGAFHFLEIGLEEGIFGAPQTVDPDFLFLAYPEICTPCTSEELGNILFAQKLLRKHGVSSTEAALSEQEYWELRGFSGSYLKQAFDHEWYHAMATRAGIAPSSNARIALIDHFCQKGVSFNLAASADHRFDASFYVEHWFQNTALLPASKEQNAERVALRSGEPKALACELRLPSGAVLDDNAPSSEISRALYPHWLRIGVRKGCAPNFLAWAKVYFGITLPNTLATRLHSLAAAASEDYGSLPDRLTRLLREPMRYLDHMPDLSVEEAVALSAMGDKMAIEGHNDQAEWLYRTVLMHHPDHERTLHHLADLMKRLGRTGAEYQLRVSAHALSGKKRGGGVWNALALAELALGQDRLRVAISLLESAHDGIEGDETQGKKYRELTTRLFHHLWGQIGLYADERGITAAQDFLREVLAMATSPQGPVVALTRPVRRVALIANQDIYQCKLYRVDQKAQQLRTAGYDVLIFDQWKDIVAFKAQITTCDAAIFYRVPAFPEIMTAITECSAQGVPSFYEIDDLVFDTTQFPPAFETYAGQITPAQHRDMACGVPLYAHAMALCDYAIGSTRVLCERMAKIVRSGRAFEHHNALGLLHLEAMDEYAARPARAAARPLVLFYGSGTLAHKDDFHKILEPALARILSRYKGRVELQLVGNYSSFQHLDPNDPAIRKMPPVWDFEQYCTMLVGADINLSVLSRTAVTDAKSEIKWMEAAMFAIPSVVSRTATHEDVIIHGETGFLCNTSKEFETHIHNLIDDPSLRRQIGERARDQVMARYDLTKMSQNLTQMFDAIVRSPRDKPLIAVVNVFYPPQAIGGATRVVYDNICDLKAQFGDQFDLCVICTREGSPAFEISAYMQDDIPVWAIGTPDQNSTEMTPRDSRMAEIFGRLLERINPDLVHFHCIQRLTSSVVDVTRRRGIPYLITVHDGWWISPRQFLLDPANDRLELYDYAKLNYPDMPSRAASLWPALAGAMHVLAVSEPFAELHRACNVPNVIALENGVSRVPDVTRQPHPDGRVRLAHIGGTERHKGLPLLRNALVARDYQNLEVLVIDHALPPGLVLHEIWGNTPVIRQGKLPQSEVDRLYKRIDVLVAPSLWPESYGLVTREALASGAWVVASDRGAIGGDVIEDVNGHIIDVSNYAALADVLARIDADAERYRQPPAALNPLRRAEDQARELVEVYNGIVRQLVRT